MRVSRDVTDAYSSSSSSSSSSSLNARHGDITNSLFQRIRNNQVDILIGTQMISKGFNFPKLNCIVVIDADFSGRGFDLRSTEKNIQLYHQLSGRAGRFSSESLVIYQTLSPHDEILNELIKNKSEELLKNELLIRKRNELPPFIRQRTTILIFGFYLVYLTISKAIPLLFSIFTVWQFYNIVYNKFILERSLSIDLFYLQPLTHQRCNALLKSFCCSICLSIVSS